MSVVARRRHREGHGLDDEGSILPLVLGYAILAIALVIVCACATSLYIAQKELDAVADSAALAGADGFTLSIQDGEPLAVLTSADVREQAAALVEVAPGDAVLVSADTPDGRSARVTVASAWHPPLFSAFVPDGVPLSATATSRTGLR
jgi:hypothetical protein